MFGLNKSRLTILGMLLLVIAVFYGGELYSNWLYQKEQQLPRLVLRVVELDGREFIFSLSQAEYKSGHSDLNDLIEHHYPDRQGLRRVDRVDCLDFRQKMKRTLSVEGRESLRAGWEYDACYPERQATDK